MLLTGSASRTDLSQLTNGRLGNSCGIPLLSSHVAFSPKSAISHNSKRQLREINVDKLTSR